MADYAQGLAGIDGAVGARVEADRDGLAHLTVGYTGAPDDPDNLDLVREIRAHPGPPGADEVLVGTFGEPNGGEYGRVGVSWLDWQLKGDAEAAGVFVGPDCGLCDGGWETDGRNL